MADRYLQLNSCRTLLLGAVLLLAGFCFHGRPLSGAAEFFFGFGVRLVSLESFREPLLAASAICVLFIIGRASYGALNRLKGRP